jgi:spermidine synthase
MGPILKISVFATGCAGIVAEFVLSTLATYLSGNAVFQWTIIMSLMLFSMGLGSRLSKVFRTQLLKTYILVEFFLSIVCSASAILAYSLYAYISQIHLVIYFLALIIGGLIGLEIPLVTRLNEAYEELRSNIASVMEKDYYGALLGGLFFAFFALPYLGLTYTPILLGGINFLVASILLFSFFGMVEKRRLVITVFTICCLLLIFLGILAEPIILYSEQQRYRDKIIYFRQTPHQKIVMTRWKKHYWLYINDQEQFSTFDEEKYHEPLVHPAMSLASDRSRILILGGGDGLVLREVWKYADVKSVTLVDLDPEMTDLAAKHPVLVSINQGAMKDGRLKVINQDAGAFLKNDIGFYSVIIIDLPDPDTIDLMHLYSRYFYRMVNRHLSPGGVMVTQATSPYFSRQAFWCIINTIQAAGITPLPYHNHIPTMGEWGWVLGIKSSGPGETDVSTLKQRVLAIDFDDLSTRFLNTDAMVSMIHFGKGMLDPGQMSEIRVNTQLNPVLHRYYLSGTWAMY